MKDLEAIWAKSREVEGALAFVQAALQESENALTEEWRASPKIAHETIAQYKEMLNFHLGLQKMGRVSYEYECRVALAHFRGRYSDLVIVEDLYATLLEDDNVQKDKEMSFDDSDPLIA
ncbi:hypothetical protein GW17_00044249 [Ensete ventricosum]|nr:hypothetical protein GW17_00044249 [Ensete ventricosum]